MTDLKLFLFGPPRAELDGRPVDLHRRKAMALLVYLAVTRRPYSRDALATLFWPDLDQQRARAYLRRDLAELRASLPEKLLIADREMIELSSDPDLWVDVIHFQRLVAARQSHNHPPDTVCADCLPLLIEAAGLYTNDFLAGFTLPDSAEFDDWQFFQSESLRQDLAWLLERLVRGLSVQGQVETAIPHARRWVALDPLHEPAQRQLMWLYDQTGQQAAALRQYEEYVELLDEELGIPPEEETTTLYEAIKAKRMLKPYFKTLQQQRSPAGRGPGGEAGEEKHASFSASLPAHFYPPAAPAAPRPRLPAQPTPFIGREQELAEIEQLLGEPGCRLLTLVGPGGIGKTRLALAGAAAAVDLFAQGVYFVSLASVSDPGLIPSAIAEALGLNFSGSEQPYYQLLTYLSEKNLLLVVDNFEHLLDGAELLSEILHAAPQVTLLVTSRERLNLQEEWGYEVGGMAFPRSAQGISGDEPASFEKYSAVRLFLQLARKAQATFSFSNEDIPHVVRICELVDGMPLGLELAAPWVRLMPCRQIAAEIESNLDFLTTSLQNVPQRHRSVRAVFEQTWERLVEEERSVLAKLSVFRGGCLRQAAEAVAGATLPLLLSLVDKALLHRTESERYEMHELIRQFSLEQLQSNAVDYEQVLDRHYTYYTLVLHRQTGAIKGGEQKEALEAITADIDNIRAAWSRAVERQDLPALEQAAGCYCLYCEMRGALHEGESAFQHAAAALATQAPAGEQQFLRGFLIAGQGMLCAHRGNLKEGQGLMEQGLSLLQQFQDRERRLPKQAFALLWLGWTLFLQGKNAEAEQTAQESFELFSEIDDPWGKAKSLFVLGNSLTARGQLAESEPPLRESQAICRGIGDRRSLLLANRNLAILTFWFGDYIQTGELLEQAAILSQEFDDRIGLAYTLRELGKLKAAEGDYPQAFRALEQSIAITDEIGSRWESAATLDDVGVVLRLAGDYPAAERALAECLEAAEAINNRYYTARCLGNQGSLAYCQADYQRAERLLRRALDMWTGMGHEPYSAWVLSQLGRVLEAAGDDREAEAKQAYARALQLSAKHKLAPFALDVFVSVAGQMIRAGEMDEAFKLLSLAEQHLASTYETREKARLLLNDLAVDKRNAADQILRAGDWRIRAEKLAEVLSAFPGKN